MRASASYGAKLMVGTDSSNQASFGEEAYGVHVDMASGSLISAPTAKTGSAGLYINNEIGGPGHNYYHTHFGIYVTGSRVTKDTRIVADGTISGSLLRSSGDVVAFYSSDERLKDNIRTIEEPIYKLRQLKGVEYEWNDKQDTYPSGSLDSGIIAQDVQKVLPQLVKEKGDGYLGVRHDRLVGLLIEAIKDQQDQIDEMKDQIKELKNGSS